MKKPKHYHVCWWDTQTDSEPHVLCLAAYNEAHAHAKTDEYLGEALRSIEAVFKKGDEFSYITCLEG